MNKNKLRIEGGFRQRIIEDDVISLQDLFAFYTDAFYLDGVEHIIILERENDDRDFFKGPNSYKKLDGLVHDYLIKRRGMSN